MLFKCKTNVSQIAENSSAEKATSPRGNSADPATSPLKLQLWRVFPILYRPHSKPRFCFQMDAVSPLSLSPLLSEHEKNCLNLIMPRTGLSCPGWWLGNWSIMICLKCSAIK